MNGISEKKLNYVHTNNFPPQRYTKIEKRYQLRCKNTQHVGRQHTQNAHTHKTKSNKGKKKNKTPQRSFKKERNSVEVFITYNTLLRTELETIVSNYSQLF